MLVTILMVLLGVPLMILLARSAWLRARGLSERIAEVQEEMARDPRPPYAALAELMQEKDRSDRGK